MSIEELSPSERTIFEKKKHKMLTCLKRTKILGVTSRMLSLVCVIPLLHVSACLGQKKPIPTVSKIGAVGFIAGVAGALVSKEKEEKNISDLYRLHERYCRTRK